MSVTTLPFSTLSDEEVKKLLTQYRIGLTVEEARKVESMLGRHPTVVEAVIWGIQGSEHSSYKSSRRFLKAFPTSGKHVILGPKEDSGIVAITDEPSGKRWGLVISHESHNHPSQIVPFEGAATGVGGTVRDVACMGARLVGTMDLLRLGDLKTPETRGIAKEVARGIAGYGNPLGLPNLGGDTVFESGFNTNCLVNAVAVGIVREDEVIHSYVPKEAAAERYDIILIGKPTDRSGFGGAAFASISMDEESRSQNTGAVQEPNPFLERHLLISTNALFDWLAATNNLHRVSYKDLGAGGVVCATVEQVAPLGYGAVVDLDKLHVALKGLPPEVMACAETQERFCWMCHPSLTETIVKHYNVDWDLPSVAENARASVIGYVTDDGIYTLLHEGDAVCHAKSEDITSGLQYKRPTAEPTLDLPEPKLSYRENEVVLQSGGKELKTSIREVFETMLQHPNHCSKEPIILHYDKSVIGNSFIEAGEADASVITPLRDLESYLPGGTHPGWDLAKGQDMVGVALAGDGNPRYGRISPYSQGLLAAVESMMNVAAVGATPRALTDCLNYGNPEVPEQLSALEQGVNGIAKAADTLRFEGEKVPVISGNVSLYNSTPDGSAIPPSAIVCCIGVMPDASKAISQQIQKPESVLLLIGERKNECGGSAYYEMLESHFDLKTGSLLGTSLPSPDLSKLNREMQFVIDHIRAGRVLASHDISDGGLLLAVFEMLTPRRKMGGTLGATIDIGALHPDATPDRVLFSQTPGFILEVERSNLDAIIRDATERQVSCTVLGSTTNEPALRVLERGEELLSADLKRLIPLWKQALTKALEPR